MLIGFLLLNILVLLWDWVKHCLSVYPKMSEEAISLAWSRTFPTSTVLRAVLRAESKAYLYFFVRKPRSERKESYTKMHEMTVLAAYPTRKLM